MNFCGYLPRAINADLRYYSQLQLFDISMTQKLESLDYFLSSSSKKSTMDVAGKVNIFIWQLSTTLHPSSSFSVCRSDCRLVHHHHLSDEVMSQVLAGFQFGAPAVVREEFPPVITCIQQPLLFSTLIQYFFAGPPIGLIAIVCPDALLEFHPTRRRRRLRRTLGPRRRGRGAGAGRACGGRGGVAAAPAGISPDAGAPPPPP